jgi:inosine-uridine nucleoside N-ribohydrolase
MAEKVILIADPGIDTAFALALALLDERLDVLALTATAGNVTAFQATVNIHTVVGQIDPPRWPRLGAAPAIKYDIDGTSLHGADGLGNAQFPEISLHSPPTSDRLIVDLVRENPNEATIVCFGPLTVVQRALQRDPALAGQIKRLICLGGSRHEPGNATAAAEFHFFCDPEAARAVIRAGLPLTVIPLDVMRKLIFSPSDLLGLPAPESRVSQFLRKIVPFGIRASSNLYGIEGFHLKDVLGVAALVLPKALTTQSVYADIELRGELTRGALVVDSRPRPAARPNVDLVTEVDVVAVRDYIFRTLSQADDGSV